MVKVISVSGVDGAGKSTQASLLYTYFLRKGYRVRYLWLRWFGFLTYPLYLYAKLTKKTFNVRRGRYVIKIHLFWLDPALRRLYPYVMALDVYMAYVVNKILSRLRGATIVILDRALLDAVVDITWETRSIAFLQGFMGRLLSKMLREVIAIVLTTSIDKVIRRKSDIVSIREFEFKKKCFETLAKHLNIPVIDTSNRSIVETFSGIVKQIATKL